LVESARATHLISRSSPATFDDVARRSAAKMISKYYFARKYALRHFPWIDGAFQVANLIGAAVALNKTKIASAYGRLRGIARVVREGH
jgi:hypothetical protein